MEAAEQTAGPVKPPAHKGNSYTRQASVSLGILGAMAVLGFALTRPSGDKPANAPAPSSDVVTVPASGAQAVKLETAPVRQQTLDVDLQATGTVSYPADQTVKVSPRVAGRVRQVFVSVGEQVKAGQPLATLESADAAAALTTLRQNENKLRLTKSVLDRQERLYKLGTSDVTAAQAALDQARAQTLAKKDALARLREQAQIGGFTQKPVEDARNAVVTARSTLAQAQSDLAQSERDNIRKTKLVTIGIAAKSDLETSTNVLEKAQVSVEADKETLALAQQQLAREQKAFKTNLYADQAVRSGESDYQQAILQQSAAEKNLRLAQTQRLRDLEQARSDYQAAQTDAQNARLALGLLGSPGEDGTIRVLAPAAGLVIERDVNAGQVVDQSQETPWQMFVLGNADTVWIDADVYEKDIAGVHIGQAARVRVDAMPGRVYEGTIRHIAPVLDPKTRAVKVRVVLANPGGALKDGMFANLTIAGSRGRAVTVVPLSAVQHDGDQDFVYVSEGGSQSGNGTRDASGHALGGGSESGSQAGGSYKKRAVKLGAARGEDVVVVDGLKSGERVVTHGALFLGDQAGGG